MKYLTNQLLQHIPYLCWDRNYDKFPNKERISKNMINVIIVTYFKLLFKFIVDTGRHVRLPGMLGYVGMFKFKPKKDLITDYKIWANTREKVLIRNNISGPYKHKIKWYRMGSSSQGDLKKVTPDYIYKFNRRNYQWYTKEVIPNSDILIKYPAIENSKIVSSFTQLKQK